MSARWNFVVLAAIIALLLPIFWSRMESVGAAMDEGAMLVYPELILHGKLPYRDFQTVYPPGNLYLLAATYSFFGTSIYVERMVGLAYRVALMVGIFGIARRWGTVTAAFSTAITGALLACSDLLAVPSIAAIPFALFSLWAITSGASRMRALAGGIFAGVALLCRIDFALAVSVSALPLFLALPRRQKILYVAGAMIALSPFVFFAIVVGPGRLADDLFFYPVFRLNPTRRLPLATADLACWRAMELQIVSCALTFIAAVIMIVREQTRDRGRLLLAIALLSAGTIPYALQRFDFAHVLFASFIPIGFAVVGITTLLQTIGGETWHKRIAPFAAGAVLIAAVCLTLPALRIYFVKMVAAGYENRREKMRGNVQDGGLGFRVEHKGRAFFLADEFTATTTGQILNELERVSTPGQRLIVGPEDLRRTNYNDTFVYYLMPQLVPATYFLEMNPRSANAPNSRLAADVATADWLLLNRAWDYWHEPNASQEYGSDEANEIVRRDFDAWAEAGGYVLYANRRIRDQLKRPDESRE